MSSSLLLRRTAGAARAFSTSSPRSFAKINIIGHLVVTPEVQATNSGREIVKYTVASNSGPRENRQSSFFKVTSFSDGKAKDFLMSLPKGSLVYVEGDASLNKYQDASGGNRFSLNIVQRNLEVLRRRSPAPEGEQAEQAEQAESNGQGYRRGFNAKYE